MIITTPWTDEQVEALNNYQRAGRFHPFTCGNRDDGKHPHEPELQDHGVLRATSEGWVCPFCDYKQFWAHDFMALPLPQDPWMHFQRR